MAERIPIAFLAGLVSVITPCVLPLVPGLPLRRLGGRGGPARRARRRAAGRRSRACRSSLGSRSSSSRSAPVPRRSATSSTSAGETRSPASCSSCSGLAFMGLLPWPERVVAPGPARPARGRRARARCSAPPSPSAPRRASAPCWPRCSCSPATRARSLRGSVLLAGVLGRDRRRLPPRRDRVRARDGRLPLAARPLRRDPVRQRRDAGRARPPALLRARLVAAT